jgi:hypothetical protein
MKRIFLCLLTFAALLMGCTDKDDFSADPSALLTFSTDSVSMDTVFSTVPTRTYDFWVYNTTNTGVRIKEVRLKQPSLSGFRVNVDGNYVDSVAYDFEVRKNDSIRVFVELTAPVVAQSEPKHIEDQLIFALESGVEQPMKLCAYSWKARFIDDELEVKEDMLIDDRQPIVIRKGIHIAKGATLTLSHTQLYFHDGAGIEVEGTLVADSCLMRGDRLDRMFDYLPYDRVSGQWKGIVIHASSLDNLLQDCEIRNACTAISCEKHSSLTLYRCTIHNCMGTGVEFNEAIALMDSCRISNTQGDCLNAIGSDVLIDHTTLAQFYPFSAERGVALRFDAKSVITCGNTLITGYEEDVVMGAGTDYSFYHCIIRTPQPTHMDVFEDIIWEAPDSEVQGKDHFVTFDTDNLIYNFSIQEKSPAFTLGIGDLRNL